MTSSEKATGQGSFFVDDGGAKNLFSCLRGKEVGPMCVTWDQLIAFSLLIATIIGICLKYAKKNR